MSHIIIFDEHGNEIGRLPDEPPPDGDPHGIAAQPTEDHPARILTLNLGSIAKGLGLDKHDEKKK